MLAGARRNVTSFVTSTSTPPNPNATTLPKLGSVTAPTMTSRPAAICCTWMPSIRALRLYFLALAVIVANPFVTSPAEPRPTSTPPASVLCRMSGETIFSATGKPMRRASFAASAALFATPSFGTGMP